MIISIAGRATYALTHMALLGLAAILRDSGVAGVRIWFADEEDGLARLAVAGDEDDLAHAVREHARRSLGDWVGARFATDGGTPRGVMSPRLAAPANAERWSALQTARWRELDALTSAHRRSDLEFIGGLGEPAYWRCDTNESQPDTGASRWEMKTRNRGEEFVGDRLGKLAAVVAERSARDIVAGLSGGQVVDDTGGSGAGSRTATGFRPPGPVDTALAWCALWGIGSFPLVHRVNGLAQTPGASPRTRIHPARMVLPVVGVPASLSRVRALIRSEALEAFFVDDPVRREGARRWLIEHDAVAIARFAIRVAGSSSAPERMVLDGSLEALT